MGAESFFELAVVEGLEAIAARELNHRFKDQSRLFAGKKTSPGTIQFAYGGSPHNLLSLKTALSVFWVLRFPIPRPKALLGHQNLTTLIGRIDEVLRLWPKSAYKTLHLAAAGSDTQVMQRIAEEIARHAGLALAAGEGDLLVRIRRPLDGSPGWEAAIRMSPRPLSVRPWRVCDREGALNAAVAQAMIQLTHPNTADVFLNLACGSATLLVERAANSPARLLIGCDTDRQALVCARANIQAARLSARIHLDAWDARSLPLPAQSVDVICTDLPFGHDTGSHSENLALYPAIIQEAARVTRDGARCVLLTHEIRLIDSLLQTTPDWAVKQTVQLSLTGLHPMIYILERKRS